MLRRHAVENGIRSHEAKGRGSHSAYPDGTDITYIVDGQGRRVGKVVNGVFERGWLWRGQLQPVAELDATGAVAKRFVYAGAANVPSLMVTSTATYRLVKDHLGSVRQVVDQGSAAVAGKSDYDGWGRVGADSSPGLVPFGFAGSLADASSGVLRFGRRDYDAESGRWSSKDPIGLAGGANSMEYAASDPVNQIDSTGLDVGVPHYAGDYGDPGGGFGVMLCSGVPQTSALKGLGLRHYWLKTAEHSGGLWGGGAWNPTFSPAPDDWADANYPGYTCQPIPDANPGCVNAVLNRVLGSRQGAPWIPGVSDCQNFAADTLVGCGANLSDLPLGPALHSDPWTNTTDLNLFAP